MPAISTIFLRGLRNARKLTGTGLAYPTKWRLCQKQKSWQQDCTNWINMANWIEADTSKSRSRLIAVETGYECVSRLVKRYGNQGRQ